MLLFSEQEFAAGGHGNLDAESLVMVTPRQATSKGTSEQVIFATKRRVEIFGVDGGLVFPQGIPFPLPQPERGSVASGDPRLRSYTAVA
jgi:hypothetical protein